MVTARRAWPIRCTGRSPMICAARSRLVNCRPAASWLPRPSLRELYRASAHGPRCDQGADDPRAGGDQTRPGHVRRATRSAPFVTTLTRCWAATAVPGTIPGSVRCWVTRRRREATSPDRNQPAWPTGGQGVAAHRGRHDREPASAAVPRREGVVAADLVLPDAARRAGRHPPPPGAQHRGNGVVPGERLAVERAGYRDTITVRIPDRRGRLLAPSRRRRVSVVETRRTAFDHQTAIRLTVSVYRRIGTVCHQRGRCARQHRRPGHIATAPHHAPAMVRR